ncbi:MAG: 3'(2'),5'-bisphosphate nucleotidase CysQ [Geminicoccaceae bacterium]|nr:3'(2'),5'-bisphosphate nucleotidase CysQ [Geminicoccaceae bacterium]
MMPPALLIPELVKLAEEAGKVVMSYYSGEIAVEMKNDRSPVTAADGAAEKVILARLRELTPNIPIVAEESASAGDLPDVSGKEFWLVDPVDGTKEFISKNGEFTINIALVSANQPILGVVYAPAVESMWWGAAGHGATKRDKDGVRAITVRERPSSGAVAVASRSHRDQATNDWLEKNRIGETVAAGSSLKFCLVAEARADVYPRFGPTMEWDVGAGHAVLSAAGGRMTDLDGRPFHYAKPDFRNTGFIAYGR